MVSKTALGILVLIMLAGGGWYLWNPAAEAPKETETPMGEYAYVCTNGAKFTMAPSENMAEIVLNGGSQGMFTGKVTLHKMGDGNHYESIQNESPLIVFSGAGEEVQLAVGNESTVCNPVPNPDMAPWNWGDPGEGGGVKQDLSLIVTENMQGKWQSADDAKFVREFRANDVAVDSYEGKEVSTGLWVVFTKDTGLEVPYPLEDNTAYVQMTMRGTQEDTLYFRVTKVTPDELELVYLNRGGVLRFKSIN